MVLMISPAFTPFHGVLAADRQQCHLTVIDRGQNAHHAGLLVPEEVALLAHGGSVHTIPLSGDDLQLTHRLSGGQKAPRLAQGCLLL